MTTNNWPMVTFADSVEINPSVPLRRGETYPFLDMASLSPGQRLAKARASRPFNGGGSRFLPGDTLMARITPCLENGKICRYSGDGPAAGSTEFIVIRGRQNITDNGFAYYLTQSPKVRGYAISKMTGSSGRQRVPTDAFQRLEIPLPPLHIQKRIAHILGTLDDKIELNRRMNETLEAMARAIFKSWFVDFDPVHAKADGRDTGLPKPIADLFPSEFQESELGPIPKGWRVGKLGDVAEINSRCIHGDYPHEVIEYIDIASVTAGRLGRTICFPLPDAPSRAKRLVSHGDTIWSCVRPNRRSFLYIQSPPENLVASTGFAVITPRTVTPSYLHAWTTTDAFVDYLTASADGSAYPAVRPDCFASAKILIPPRAALLIHEQAAGRLHGAAAHNVTGAARLASSRDALLPRLLSGELAVPKAVETILEVK
jgi:type I restriction enzyme S subunit